MDGRLGFREDCVVGEGGSFGAGRLGGGCGALFIVVVIVVVTVFLLSLGGEPAPWGFDLCGGVRG